MVSLNFLKYSVELMPSKASKASERDLNINLSIKISATDFPIGFISTAFIAINDFLLYKNLSPK